MPKHLSFLWPFLAGLVVLPSCTPPKGRAAKDGQPDLASTPVRLYIALAKNSSGLIRVGDPIVLEIRTVDIGPGELSANLVEPDWANYNFAVRRDGRAVPMRDAVSADYPKDVVAPTPDTLAAGDERVSRVTISELFPFTEAGHYEIEVDRLLINSNGSVVVRAAVPLRIFVAGRTNEK
jgi:hypothetical protein